MSGKMNPCITCWAVIDKKDINRPLFFSKEYDALQFALDLIKTSKDNEGRYYLKQMIEVK